MLHTLRSLRRGGRGGEVDDIPKEMMFSVKSHSSREDALKNRLVN